MKISEFQCLDCGQEFKKMVSRGDDLTKICCPYCQSTNTTNEIKNITTVGLRTGAEDDSRVNCGTFT